MSWGGAIIFTKKGKKKTPIKWNIDIEKIYPKNVSKDQDQLPVTSRIRSYLNNSEQFAEDTEAAEVEVESDQLRSELEQVEEEDVTWDRNVREGVEDGDKIALPDEDDEADFDAEAAGDRRCLQ